MSGVESRSSVVGSWSAAAGWTVGVGALAAQLWLYAYSFPAPALVAQVVAAVVTIGTVGAAIGWALSYTRPAQPLRDAAGSQTVRAATVLVMMAVGTFGLCALRAPMWLRLGEATPQMLWLAHRAQPESLSGALSPASAGTYHFSNVYRSQSGYVVYVSATSGLLQFSCYVYSPRHDPGILDQQAGFSSDDGVRYRHLVGPWWAETDDVPGA